MTNRRRELLLVTMILTLSATLHAQVAPNANLPAPDSHPQSINDSVRELREQVRELQSTVASMHSEFQQSRAETAELRRQLDQVRAGAGSGDGSKDATLKVAGSPTHSDAAAQTSLDASRNSATGYQDSTTADNQSQSPLPTPQSSSHDASLEEQYDLLSGKVDDQYQTKVESASKYRLRLSGIVLMNLVSNQGVVDSIDLPQLAYARPAGDSGGSFGATLRQSEIGFEAFGPTVAGAKTRADLQLDLSGGFPNVPNGVNSGVMRLRTATMRMDWENTSVVVGQDALFFSPNSPTSFASLAEPALSYAGNLWSWVPQIRVEHRLVLSNDSSLLLQGGILDPVSGELAETGVYRQPDAGESSRQPAFAARVAWTKNVLGQPLRVGVGSFYSRQDYGFDRTVDAWASMTDIDLPLSHAFSLSGKLYRGKGLGGLYGGLGRSALFSGDPTLPDTQVRGLNSVGGWAQLKYRPAAKWEFNAAFGLDNPYATDLKRFPYAQAYGNPTLARNDGSFVNMIYRPRSDLLFSAEYRRLRTYSLTDGLSTAGHLNLSMGVLF